MRIQNNITALNTYRQYNTANNSVAGSAEKLSSGYKINRAGDDAAGLAISEKMRAQIRGLNMASKNSSDAVSLIQTAEGALQSTHNILQRMRELAVQSASDTNEKTIDRGALDAEFQQLKKEIDETASKTRFNDQNLIDGTFASTKYSVSQSAGAFVGSAMVGKAPAGVYTLGVKQVTVGNVAAADASASATKTSAAVSSVSFTGGTALEGTAYYNGDWELGFNSSTSSFFLKQGDRVITATASNQATSIAAGGTLDLTFGSFGDLEITLASAFDGSVANPNFDSLATNVDGTSVNVTGGRDYAAGVTKHYATMTGAMDVELNIGDTEISFTNGITLTFAGLSSSELARSEDADKMATDGSFAIARMVGDFTVSSWAGDSLVIQSGANQGDELAINIDKMDTNFLGISRSKISSRESASYAITQTNNAINQVSSQRASLGALQNRLNHKIANLDNSAENLTAAESRIRDVDMAKEMTAFTKNNILVQASTAMLAQANSLPQNVLQLLG